MRTLWAWGVLSIEALVACQRDSPPPTPDPRPTPVARSVDAAEVASAVSLSPLLAEADSGARARARKQRPPKRATGSKIPGASFVAGSLPGDEGREPRWEPTSLPITLSAYRDRRLASQRSGTTTAHRLVAKGCGAALCCARRAPLLGAGMGIRMQGRAWRRLRVGRRLGSSVHP